MSTRTNLLAMTAVAALMVTPVLAQNTSTPRDGTPGNPPSTATQRAADAATGNVTPPDGTPGNPPGTAVSRAIDRAAGTNMSGAYPQNSDGTPNNPPGTAIGRAADNATSNAPNTRATTGSVASPGSMAASPSASSAMPSSPPRVTAASDMERASKIIGTNVYNDRNESIGSVDDIVLTHQGGARTAILSVGGFLGIGAKLVAVPFDQLRFDSGQNRWVISGATKESLTALPTFEYGTGRG
ncbi:PRC-barrel domain-containing protein [Roseomonas sp. OT10]|uniref:PRC-barrel domain-containing protein n=1 Tax=Roseomonas cutis TaxID=2897332 RepID=UPI001E5BCE6B|nr:PRC-barrel domain-containing protein [Roseomonas sp. OT10]UFN47010.1 PRC-barrel domain-containing protein [Roseomonas sp. OT10]